MDTNAEAPKDDKPQVLVDREQFTAVIRKLIATPPMPKATIPRKRSKTARPKAQSKAKQNPAE